MAHDFGDRARELDAAFRPLNQQLVEALAAARRPPDVRRAEQEYREAVLRIVDETRALDRDTAAAIQDRHDRISRRRELRIAYRPSYPRIMRNAIPDQPVSLPEWLKHLAGGQ